MMEHSRAPKALDERRRRRRGEAVGARLAARQRRRAPARRGHSNARTPLRAVSVVPEELAALHEKIRAYRNTTVAHSRSELVRPAPIAYLDQAGRIRRVGDAVISQHLPRQIARQFAGLIGLVQNTVEGWADDIRARLEER